MSQWIESFKNRFYLNFIKDDRWHYITRGLWTTVQITVMAVLLGIVIGFIIAIIRSTHDKTGKMKIPNFICKVYLTVIRGTPVVVQLLIIYFVVFASVNIGKMFVAVVAFGINSGAYVAEIVRSGIMSIDKGQLEAGRSLGFSYAQTMVYVIIPQAFKNVLPALGNELIVLLKETSVSGYIAMEDLTKGGDIIRSRTYDAMMPLLAVAVIYLVIVVFLEFLMGKLERRLRSSDH
ncbi:MAG: amino acid ABC transporter permease [Oscillospiraceae bacterium]|nr:amino acid ABC transporter permease [Oscillospiraceae bacterium]